MEQQYSHKLPNTGCENKNSINVVIRLYQKDRVGIFTCILSGCQSGRGSFPKGVLQMRSHRETPGMRPGLKHPPLHSITRIKKTAAGGEHDGVMHEGPEGVPRGSAQIPTQWRGQRIGCGYGCGGDEHHTRASL